MPKMDGIETTLRLREMGYAKPIVALTANAVVGQSNIFLENGFDGFISKPIDIRQLNILLNKMVRDMYPSDVVERARKNASVAPVIDKSFDEYAAPDRNYEKLYKDFARNQKNFVPDLTDAIKTNNVQQAYFLAHTMKGVAGLIGENNLVALAAKAEAAFRDGKVPNGVVPLLIEEAERVLEMISEKHPDSNRPRADAVFDEAEAKNVFDELMPLLEEENFEALDLCEKLAAIPKTEELIRQIENMDFDLASETLKNLRTCGQ